MPRKSIPDRKQQKASIARVATRALWNKGRRINPEVPLIRVAFVFSGKKGNGKKKAMIVERHFSSSKAGKQWIYYPTPEEAVLFASSFEHLKFGGSVEYVPGCVGAVSGKYTSTNGKRLLVIDTIQGGFIQEKTTELSRALVSKHGGWRQHLLDHIFKEVTAKNIDTVVFDLSHYIADRNRLIPQGKIIVEIALRAADKNGFERLRKRESWKKNHLFFVRKVAAQSP